MEDFLEFLFFPSIHTYIFFAAKEKLNAQTTRSDEQRNTKDSTANDNTESSQNSSHYNTDDRTASTGNSQHADDNNDGGADSAKKKIFVNLSPEQARTYFAISAVVFGFSLFMLIKSQHS